MKSQAQKAADFAALHQSGCFVIPNPWDRGSARMLAGLGFKALTTTSAGCARSIGVTDYRAGRDHVLAHCRDLVDATDLPLAADLEDGFGPAPEDCAETIRLGAEAGLVGGSIEDWRADGTFYDIEAAAERIRAAAEAARSLDFPFQLVARCENYLRGKPDFADTVRRLQAYQEAGADVLYAPCLTTAEEYTTLLREVDRPVNALGGIGNPALTVSELAALGARRISLGSLLHSAAMTAFLKAATDETFGFVAGLTSGGELDRLLEKGSAG
ncbi:2-methylisocitrate lyase [Asticcacaulis sp. AC460]|uniref:isocitrate lyase/PEP mutase family protein n=1 Tax=Asticcacaulis sp. AC460 TaxID=1282360 RepID=UPI0003C3FF75|nr:isocitrate lyase/phosphoenolpyruvate mutase family protein [Asticcacaulis sp. AC460]ESQ88160.1 2-methylisocitrate lyase [Asticcacaulis sp. AC460]